MIVHLAWPLVALLALTVASVFTWLLAWRWLPADQWRHAIEQRQTGMAREVLTLGERVAKLNQVALDVLKSVEEQRKRLEANELRKLGGGR